MKKLITYIILVIALADIGHAQSFTASASSTRVGEADQFQVSFTFEGNDINGLKDFSPPNFGHFLILSGPNQSSSMQIINGAVSASITYTYYLQPRSAGNHTIGSASINLKGTVYNTEPFKIEVVRGSIQSAPGKQKQSEPAISTKEIAENLFIRASADKNRAYKGEQVTVTYKLYTRLNIASQMSVSKLPQYQGFWAEELETSSNISFTTEMVNGKQFRVGVLKRVALFPTETGELSVTPFELNVPVMIQKKRRGGNIFDDFFNDPFFSRGETIEYDAKSNTIKIDVQSLPLDDAPASFSGAVGNFNMNSQINTTKTKTNEPVSLKIDISGTGNIQLLNIPEIELPSGFEKYEPKTAEQVNRSSRVSGKKSIEYLLVPRTAGEKEIPPVEFSYFNPDKRSYVTLTTPSYTIRVEQGERDAQSAYAGKENVKELGNDIRYIKTSAGSISKKGEIVLYQYGFWVATFLPLFAAAGLVAWKRRDEKLSGNVQLMRYTKAQKVARARLKKAKQLMEAKKETEFYAEISQALFGYLEDKLRMPKADFTVERAVDELRHRRVNESLINEFKFCAERTDYIRFAPAGNVVAAMNEIYNQSANVIIELEKSFAVKKDV
ncbi:MAG: BatD family protein [Ignavibacteriaceae bacterium]